MTDHGAALLTASRNADAFALANCIRSLSIDGVEAAQSGHPGAPMIRRFGDGRDLTLLATGTEVSLAVEAAERLSLEGLGVAVVSMPCWERFEAQPKTYRDETLGTVERQPTCPVPSAKLAAGFSRKPGVARLEAEPSGAIVFSGG